MNLVICPGHAIFQRGQWYGGYYGEDHFYAGHVHAALELLRSSPSDVLVFSGGCTRSNDPAVRNGSVTNSEAAGMLEFAKPGLSDTEQRRIALEPWARDSFENVFYSLLACFHRFGAWPASVYAVTWPFKANRFYMIACGLGLGDRFIFRGNGDLENQEALEVVTRVNVQYEQAMAPGGEILDPLHRGPDFVKKRLDRMPGEFTENTQYIVAVKEAYGASAAVDAVESCPVGPEWRNIEWPWQQ